MICPSLCRISIYTELYVQEGKVYGVRAYSNDAAVLAENRAKSTSFMHHAATRCNTAINVPNCSRLSCNVFHRIDSVCMRRNRATDAGCQRKINENRFN